MRALWSAVAVAAGGMVACGITTTDGNDGSGGRPGGKLGEEPARSGGGSGFGGEVGTGGAPSGSGGSIAGTGGAQIGSDCSEGEPETCAGANQRDVLSCVEGSWQVSSSCGLGSQCDTSTGECAELVDECVTRDPGDRYCGSGDTVYECGPDRVTGELIGNCSGPCDSASGTCENACEPDHGGCDPVVSCTTADAGALCGDCPGGYVGEGDSGCAPLLLELEVSVGSLTPAFNSQIASYELRLPLRVETISLTGATVEGAQITINDQAAFVGGATWTSPTLAWGTSSFEIEVTRPGGLSTTYQLLVRRGIETQLKASNADPNDYFGNYLALSGDGTVLAVGAYGEASGSADPSDNSVDAAGAVYVFRRTNDAWAQEAYLKSPSPDVWDFFGQPVALSFDGAVLAVGAPNEAGGTNDPADDSRPSAGAVFVFERSGGSWTGPAYVKPAVPVGRSFGRSVSLSGDGTTLAVGANDDSPATGINGNASATGANSSGAAYVFVKSSAVWTQQAYVKASNTGTSDDFGRSVALASNGSTLVVGAPGEASRVTGDQLDNAGTNVGAVYVFSRTGTAWAQGAYLKAQSPTDGSYFGYDLDISADGTTIAIGAWDEASAATGINGNATDTSAPGAGAAFVFSKSGLNWSQQAYLKASNTQADDSFGTALSLSGNGNVLVVGASGEDSSSGGFNGNQSSNSWPNSGAVYAFRRLGSTWTQTTYLKQSSPDGGYFGAAVGLSDDARFLAVGAYTQGTTGNRTGAVYVY